jgi:putative component of membrane protein insertase Oxa1/YidC/SpoIIIJ protein YidD
MVILIALLSVLPPEIASDLDFITRANPLVRVDSEAVPAADFTLRQVSELRLCLSGMIRLYQVFVSPQGPPGCNFTVTCSRFMTQAVQECGLAHGLLMASDRLTRCNGSGQVYYARDLERDRAIDHPAAAYYLFRRGRIIRRPGPRDP